MLLQHLNGVEERLRALARDAVTPAALRQAFAGQFVEPMFGAEWRVDAGRLVGRLGEPGAAPAVFDLLLCQRSGPRLQQADGGVACFAESALAAITLVPTLDEASLVAAVRTARAAKLLDRTALRPHRPGEAGQPPPLRCHLVAFDGPPDMPLVHQWLKRAYREQAIDEPDLPPTGDERCQWASPALDGVFVLGRGFLNFDNLPFGFITDEVRAATFGLCWAIASSERHGLLALWLQLEQAAAAFSGWRLDPAAFVNGFEVKGLRYGN